MPNEPQSYGSQGEWVTGKTGQQVNRQKSEPPANQAEFYDNRRESETSAPDQGGQVSDVQLQDNQQAADCAVPVEEVMPTKRVSDQATGAKRSSFFKDRDYNG